MKRQILLVLLVFCTLTSLTFSQGDWRPISDEELKSVKPLVESDADAEVLFWEVTVEDKFVPRAGYSTILNHYIRIKIFTDRGREDNSKVDIQYGRSKILGSNVGISHISARTINKDGSVVLLDEKDIFERQIVSTGAGTKVNAKSFVPPGLKTGSIIEYRWKEIRDDSLSLNLRLQIAREIPVRKLKYSLKPVSAPGFPYAMRIQSFNTQTNLEKEDDGFYGMTFENIRSFRKEPYMPPEYDVRPWLLIYYEDEDEDTGLLREEYWRNQGKYNYEAHKSIFKNKKNIKSAALEAVGDAAEPLEKVKQIFNFCRTKIKNVNNDALGLTPDEREKIKENRNEEQTLKNGQGTTHDIDSLFAAMLNAAGFEVRIADSTARFNPRFNPELLNSYLLQYESVAVKVDGEWLFMKPSLQHLPFGMLDWSREGQKVLISDNKKPVWSEIPISNADQNKRVSKADLSIDGEGTISGSMAIEFTGHLAARYKENLDGESPAERSDAVESYVQSLISNSAELDEIEIQNLDDPEKPLVYKFKISVSGYAVRTGKRFFLSPSVMAHGTNAVFNTSTRQNDIFFDYAWSEDDQIEIEIPDGFNVEISDPPKTVVDTRSIGTYTASISYDEAARKIKYRKRFTFGKPGSLEFGVDTYSRLKALFDSYHAADQHAITLIKE